MRMKVEYEGDFYEDRDTLRLITNASELAYCLSEAQAMVRARLKWEDDLGPREEEFLRELQSILHVECLE